MHKKIKRFIPVDDKTIVDIYSSSSGLFATEQERLEAMMFADYNKMSISTYYGNGFENRDIFKELDLKLPAYSVKNVSRCDEWDTVVINRPNLPLHLNKCGDLYIILGFNDIWWSESKEEETNIIMRGIRNVFKYFRNIHT